MATTEYRTQALSTAGVPGSVAGAALGAGGAPRRSFDRFDTAGCTWSMWIRCRSASEIIASKSTAWSLASVLRAAIAASRSLASLRICAARSAGTAGRWPACPLCAVSAPISSRARARADAAGSTSSMEAAMHPATPRSSSMPSRRPGLMGGLVALTGHPPRRPWPGRRP